MNVDETAQDRIEKKDVSNGLVTLKEGRKNEEFQWTPVENRCGRPRKF